MIKLYSGKLMAMMVLMTANSLSYSAPIEFKDSGQSLGSASGSSIGASLGDLDGPLCQASCPELVSLFSLYTRGLHRPAQREGVARSLCRRAAAGQPVHFRFRQPVARLSLN